MQQYAGLYGCFFDVFAGEVLYGFATKKGAISAQWIQFRKDYTL